MLPGKQPFDRRVARGIVCIGLAMLGAGRADARASASETGLPDGTRLTAVAAPASDPYQRGKLLLASNDVPGAVAAFRAALADDPQSVDALNGLGIAFDRLGRYDIARGYYDMALALAPESPLVLNNLGFSLYLQGQDSAAVPFLRRAVAMSAPGGALPAQRILTMIADRMRTAVVASDTATARAEPGARVEVSANGEQRLVLLAAAPPRELVASLGEAAVLTTPAVAWTARDDAAIAASLVPPPVAPPAATGPVVLPAGQSVRSLAFVPGFPVLAVRRSEPVRRDENIAAAAMTATRFSLATATIAPPVRPRRERRDASFILVAALDPNNGFALPASLLAPLVAAPPAANVPPVGAAHFDSDDAALNAFAARMAVWLPVGRV